ncbi:MAG TPA: sigma-70 family RNA polymerase sigma factor [Pyrinomonadaceae bacterium]|nr:sigma-70 family RNA polymerase sigma factor [Pyrinomonadaceae bacterium]
MSRTSTETPDELLVIEAILGDFEAFDELALRYRAAVVRTAQSIVGREDAEDVAQDALLLAFKALPSIEDPTKFAAWLSAITRNRALRFNRQESAHKRGRIEFDELLLEKIGALAGPFVSEDSDEEVRLAIENIPADYALVLRLRFQDEMPLKRIAAFLGITLANAKWRVHRGKKLLREQIEILRLRGETWKEIKSF